MSQAGSINGGGGPPPPPVATTYVTDLGVAVPALNILDVFGGETNVNNDNGIRTTGVGNVVTVELTNRITGVVTTNDATPTILISLNMGATPGVYYVTGSLVAYDVTDVAGAAYSFGGAARTDGVVGTEIAIETKDIYEEAAMAASDFTLQVVGNTASIVVTGLPASVINWSALATYRFVG